MKKLLFPILLFLSITSGAFWWFATPVEVQRATASVQVDDARLRVWYNLVAPNYADTTAANTNLGLDYIGALIHTKTPAAIYFRDTSAAHHKWSILASTPASPIWGLITGTLSSQTDLQTALNAKQNTIALGTTAQYFRGDLSLAVFPTDLSSFTNGPGYLTGVNVSMSIAGDGSVGTPLKLLNDNASPGANKYYGTDNGGTKGWNNVPVLGGANGLSVSSQNIVWGGNPLLNNTTVHAAFHNFLFDSLTLYQIKTLSVATGFSGLYQMNSGGTTFLQSNNLVGASAVNVLMNPSLSSTDGSLVLGVQKGSVGSGTFQPTVTMSTIDSSILIQGRIINFVSDSNVVGAKMTIDALPYTTSSTNMASVGWNNVTKQVFAIPYGGSGGGGGGSTTKQTISASATATTATKLNLFIDPSSVVGTLAITTEASPTDGDVLSIFGGGTITGGSPVVNNFSMVGGGGATFNLISPIPTSLNAGARIIFIYNSTHTQWYGPYF